MTAAANQLPIGVLGGTFDPIHLGHLRTALELLRSLPLAEVRFIPARLPPHRPPAVAADALRWGMVQAAIAGQQGFVADDRELRRDGPSYMIDTLASLAAEHPGRPLCLLLGGDAFTGLPTWQRAPEILELAHVVVAVRPGTAPHASGPAARLLAERQADSAEALRATRAGRILVRSVTQLDISASAIRACVAAGGDARFLVPDAVREIIMASGCYRLEQPAAAGNRNRN